MCVFNEKLAETVRDRTKVTISHKQEVIYAISDEMKIIELGSP